MAGKDRRKKGDQALALALADGLSVKAAGERAGMSERTAFRRLQDRSFQAERSRIQQIVIRQGVAVIVSGQAEAALCLRRLLKSADERVQSRAASLILQLGWRGVQVSDFGERLATLEANAKEASA